VESGDFVMHLNYFYSVFLQEDSLNLKRVLWEREKPYVILEFKRVCDAVAFASLFLHIFVPHEGSVQELKELSTYNTSLYRRLFLLEKPSALRDLLSKRRTVCIIDESFLLENVRQKEMMWSRQLAEAERFLSSVEREAVRILDLQYRKQLLEERDMARRSGVISISKEVIDLGYGDDEVLLISTYFGNEELYAALASFTLRKMGYIVFPEGIIDKFVNLGGVPDLIAVKLGDFQHRLIRDGVIEGGALITEINLHDILGRVGFPAEEGGAEEAVAVEVESQKYKASEGRRQLESYLSSGCFDYGLLVAPERVGDEEYYPQYGYITWDEHGKKRFYRGHRVKANPDKKSDLLHVSKRLIYLQMMK